MGREPAVRSETGQGIFGEVRDSRGTLEDVRDGSRDPRGGLGRVR